MCEPVTIATDNVGSGGVATILADDDGKEASTRSVSGERGES